MAIQSACDYADSVIAKLPPKRLLDFVRAEELFDTLRNRSTGTVICPECGIQYPEIRDVTMKNISTDEAEFYCVICGERL